MNNTIIMKEFLNNFKKTATIQNNVPLGFGAGLPIVQIVNKNICIMIPYFQFVRVNAEDQSRIHPIKYVATILWPSGKIVKFEDLSFNERFVNVDFSKPIGFFRHETVKKYNSGQYKEKKDELYAMYDKLINYLVDDSEYTLDDEEGFKELLNIVIEPSLKPIYKFLDIKFYNKFLV